jgi:hypothetical protein
MRVMLSRGYGPFFAGNLLSNSGTRFQNVAQALLIVSVGIVSLPADPVNTLTPAFSTEIFERPTRSRDFSWARSGPVQ